jgi:GH15 family glucan-1,4-alpha-glucosidase
VEDLCSSWSRPCFDWWEEHAEHVHVSTLGCIAAGLRAIAATGIFPEGQALAARTTAEDITSFIQSQGVRAGHLTKWIGTEEVDASLLALIAPLAVLNARESIAAMTVDVIEARITVGEGAYRYAGDTYYGGGQWPLLSCFLGLAHAAAGHGERARQILDWVVSTAGADGSIPEQVDWQLLAPEYYAQWVERWGRPADPLLWSHAMFLRLAAELRLTPQPSTPRHREDGA